LTQVCLKLFCLLLKLPVSPGLPLTCFKPLDGDSYALAGAGATLFDTRLGSGLETPSTPELYGVTFDAPQPIALGAARTNH
jgi:hypothetical protein